MLKNICSLSFMVLGLFAGFRAAACDACGCGVGSYQFGILPQLNKNFAGIRYQHKTDRATPKHELQSEETFQTIEAWGRFYPMKRVQVFAILPYHFNQQKLNGKTTNVQGIGDALVLANYNLLNNTDSLYQKVKQNLLLGGGVKLPTGNFREEIEGKSLNPNLQTGSGSYDLVANVIYTVRYDKIGLNTDATYKYNTQNSDQFRFGNKFAASARLFSVLKVKESAFMPNAGVSFETTGNDRHYGDKLRESGGHITFLNLGTEAYFMNFAAGVTWQKPVLQDVSDGYVETGNRLMTHLTCMF